MKPADRLIIALDVPTIGEAENVVASIGSTATFYKIGYQLVFAGGLELARDLVRDGHRIFLDMKLLDIDNTVAKGVENIVEMGVTMLTIHAYPKTMAAAVAAASGSPLCLLGVTVMTSLDDDDIHHAGYAGTTRELVATRTKQARDAGMGGVVASAHEASMIRQLVGQDMAVVTPGIRPQGSATGDQKRVMNPAQAILARASHLVVGRPIIDAPDRGMAVKSILAEIESVS